MHAAIHRKDVCTGAVPCVGVADLPTQPPGRGRCPVRACKEMSWPPTFRSTRTPGTNAGSPTGRESYGDGGLVVVAGVTTCQGVRESRTQGEGGQVIRHNSHTAPSTSPQHRAAGQETRHLGVEGTIR